MEAISADMRRVVIGRGNSRAFRSGQSAVWIVLLGRGVHLRKLTDSLLTCTHKQKGEREREKKSTTDGLSERATDRRASFCCNSSEVIVLV